MAKQSATGPRPKRTSSKAAAVRARRQRSGRVLWIAIVIIVVVGVALGFAARSGSKSDSVRSSAPAALVTKATSVPASVVTSVGAGTASSLPKSINAPALTADGKPRVLYVGAEYCPFCAAERWPTVVALSRFGTFSGLSVTHSSTVDTFPGTNTFSFFGSTYTSTYLAFEAVELQTNEIGSDGNYKKLETPTAEQQQLVSTYDAPPYVAASSAGAIPFIDFGGKYLISGATYDPAVLQGRSADEIATALSDATTPISRGVVGAANAMTAALCKLTGDQPAATCANAAIRSLQTRLGA